MTYAWTASAGKIISSGAAAQLDTTGLNPVPDADPVRVSVRVRASDGRGGEATATVEIEVTAPPKVSIAASPTSVRFRNAQAVFYLAVRKHPAYRGAIALQFIPQDAPHDLTATISPYRFLMLTHRVVVRLERAPSGSRDYRVLVRAQTDDGRTYDSNVIILRKQ
ncbi:hypothetical protein HRbin08_01748 [bacterium HR08]|nr:hypothetical protein HRbin08_01748 [bacterium HR08]